MREAVDDEEHAAAVLAVGWLQRLAQAQVVLAQRADVGTEQAHGADTLSRSRIGTACTNPASVDVATNCGRATSARRSATITGAPVR